MRQINEKLNYTFLCRPVMVLPLSFSHHGAGGGGEFIKGKIHYVYHMVLSTLLGMKSM
jgi:hypothetical protein